MLVSDGELFDEFGSSVSVDGDVAIVGAVADSDNGTFAGAAYVHRFDGTTWNEEAKLPASDGAANDFFGTSVAVRGNIAVVGAPFNDFAATDSGSVYVYQFDGTSWFQQAVIRGPGNLGLFGQSVDLGDATDFHENVDADLLLIVGAPRDHDFHGAAYTYFWNEFGWHGWQELYALIGDFNTWTFGASVSFDRTSRRAVVGAPLSNGAQQTASGFTYVFSKTFVTLYESEALLEDATPATDEHFGTSVSIDPDQLVVGAPNTDVDRGSASI